MAKKYIINGKPFNSQKELKQYIKSIKNSGAREIQGDEFDFMLAWLKYSQPDNCIPDIVRIYVAYCLGQPEYYNVHFRVTRKDNSDEELSWWPFTSKSTIFSTACRRAVDGQIESAKQGRTNVQVHHEQPYFNTIVKWFIEKYKIDIEKVEYVEQDINKNYLAKVFKDGWLAERFRQFHQKHAKLKVVNKIEHNKLHFSNI